MDVTDFAAGGPFSVILTRDGQVYTCGYGALGLGKEVQTLEPRLVSELNNKDIVKVFAATDYAAALSSKLNKIRKEGGQDVTFFSCRKRRAIYVGIERVWSPWQRWKYRKTC